MKKKLSGSNTFTVMIATLMSMVLCACLLFGTTYAWFTASVESGSNVIKTGTFNVSFYVSDTYLGANAEGWTTFTGLNGQLMFDNRQLSTSEPVVKYIKITNSSPYTASFSLQIALAGETNEQALLDNMQVFTYIEPSAAITSQSGSSVSGSFWTNTHNNTEVVAWTLFGGNSVTVAPNSSKIVAIEIVLTSGITTAATASFTTKLIATQIEAAANP